MADQKRTGLMDWEDVRVFLALARHGGLSATARALGVNHATVSRRVAGLEQSLGLRLFERRPTGYVLTEAGQAAVARAGGMEAAAAALGRIEDNQPMAGLVRLTATHVLVDGFLVEAMAEFQRDYPAVDVELVADMRAMSLARHEVDIALRLARPQQGELLTRKLVTLDFGFYASPTWRDRLAAGEAPCFIGFDEAAAHVPSALWHRRRFPTARFGFRCNSHFTQAAAARAGCGIALLPLFVARGQPDLVPVLESEMPLARELWMLTRPDLQQSPPIRAMATFLAELFRQRRGDFAADR